MKKTDKIYVGIFIVLSLLNFIVFKCGYLYRPKNYTVFFVLYSVMMIGLLLLSILKKSPSLKITANFMPLSALLYLISLFFVLDLKIDHMSYGHITFIAISAVTVIPSLILFFKYASVKWLKIVTVIIMLPIAAALGLIIALKVMIPDFGAVETVQSVDSPNNTYTAVLISCDEGALGGDKRVEVRDTTKDIHLLLGNLNKVSKIIWQGSWGSEPSLRWDDDTHLLIDGNAYDVQNLKLNNFYRGLNVYIPDREADYYEDTHDGFMGAGMRFQQFVLSEWEKYSINKNIENNQYWIKLNQRDEKILFGGADSRFPNGILMGNVPHIDEGYFCVYNKQTEKHEFPYDGYSYNYIVGIYSEKDSTLYFFEWDN